MGKQQLLNDLKDKMKNDVSLPLRSGATQLVFGDGNPDSEILFIGEGPGYWEDQKGVPFVGNAGALLNQLLLKIGMERSDVYITNVVHHRPPNNRDPSPEEIAAYKPYLDGIIEIINPKIIITLGRFSMGKFLPGVFISGIHGKEKTIDWNGKKITMIPMYHPAAGLRSTEVKLKLTADFEKIPQILEDINKKDDKIDEDGERAEQLNLI